MASSVWQALGGGGTPRLLPHQVHPVMSEGGPVGGWGALAPPRDSVRAQRMARGSHPDWMNEGLVGAATKEQADVKSLDWFDEIREKAQYRPIELSPS